MLKCIILAGVAQLVEHLFCKQVVTGSIPVTGSTGLLGYQSGQMDLAVDEMAYAFGGSNPSPSTSADIAQLAERILGKNEVPGSTPGVGSRKIWQKVQEYLSD